MLSQGVEMDVDDRNNRGVESHCGSGGASEYHSFRIDVIDEGNGIPMVRISAANAWAYSDSQGVVA